MALRSGKRIGSSAPSNNGRHVWISEASLSQEICRVEVDIELNERMMWSWGGWVGMRLAYCRIEKPNDVTAESTQQGCNDHDSVQLKTWNSLYINPRLGEDWNSIKQDIFLPGATLSRTTSTEKRQKWSTWCLLTPFQSEIKSKRTSKRILLIKPWKIKLLLEEFSVLYAHV